MSDTPRTDRKIAEIEAAPSDVASRFRLLADFARELESELTKARHLRIETETGGGGSPSGFGGGNPGA